MDMAVVGAACAEHRKLSDGPSVLGLRLHDLGHDFVQQEAKKHNENQSDQLPFLTLSGRHIILTSGMLSELWIPRAFRMEGTRFVIHVVS